MQLWSYDKIFLHCGQVLQLFYKKSIEKSEEFARWRIARFNAAVLQLEQAYRGILKSGRTSFKDGFLAAYLILKIHIYTFETYFLAVGVWVLAFSSRTFLAHPLEHDVPDIQVSIFVIALVTAIPLVMAFVTIPIQIVFKIRMSLMTLAHAGLSALAVSIFQPVLLSSIYGTESLSSTRLFTTMLVIYMITNLYMTLILKDTICIVYFGRRQLANGFIEFIPPHKRGDLIALTSQDHYVEFITDKGAHLHRISMKDAILLIPKSTGMQVHRSHWVAYAAMHKLESASGRYLLTLANNAVIPVSKTNFAAVQAAMDNR